MYKASLTSKGQLTIPKEIRDFLELDTGDEVVFTVTDIDNKTIFFEKVEKKELCPACNGTGEFIELNLPCFLCDQEKYITKDKQIINPQLLYTLAKNKVTLTIKTQEPFSGKGIMMYELPRITLSSFVYPETVLNKIQDLLQMELVKEYAQKNLYNPLDVFDSTLNNILELFITNKGKEEVKAWFWGTKR
ncbi:AbrB/MazE/SpoVT family DNA-binding domain-containing protein [Lysinibacillus sphaericus]|uniref:AbrB/MazE/SpoVT family DNA-binding domain-containing protein n=1 Tax=Lysinibacillus sphaericus TaxID=1421 RepID=UPI000C17C210|nr:AbrB/MazE/SpoVT family DNA-binding domain-containing protein [Lysinibacillus sphaericus]PIJ98023.1 hypothetical protein CTN02_09775 [Lysinibacillus sphaericus]